jgi:type III secretory pathway component EscS
MNPENLPSNLSQPKKNQLTQALRRAMLLVQMAIAPLVVPAGVVVTGVALTQQAEAATTLSHTSLTPFTSPVTAAAF